MVWEARESGDGDRVRVTGAQRVEDGLRAGADAELGVDGSEVMLEGVLTNEETLGDGGVPEALGEEGEDLALAGGEGSQVNRHGTSVPFSILSGALSMGGDASQGIKE